jgi:uncharacterized protein
MRRFALAFLCAEVCCLPALSAASQTIQIDKNNKTIAISTTDEATAVADIAAVTVGFEVFGPDYDAVYAEGGKISQAVMEALHKAGVDDKSIESSGQGLQRNTQFDDKDTAEQRAQKQFVMRQSWEVSVPPQAAAEVIRAAVAVGANQSGAIDWRLSDRKALQAKAAANALVKARAVASQMAEGLHVKLGDLIYASNQTPAAPEFAPRQIAAGMGGNAGGGLYELKSLLPLEIRPQTIREEATVYAVFAIE